MVNNYQKNLGRPGMPPSPNQQIVLDALKVRCEQMDRDTPNNPGVDIYNLQRFMASSELGGWRMDLGAPWHSWHYNTVRAHLDALVHRGHVTKQIIKRSYYRPV